jgi:vacuolar protein sorting-associated protein 35
VSPQVFPDEFHLRTLDEILEACGQLQSGVDVKAILIALMNRLAAYAKAEPGNIPPDVNMLEVFHTHVTKMAATVDLAGILDLQVALLNFSLGFAPEKLDFVDQILEVRRRVSAKALAPLSQKNCGLMPLS